MSNAVVTTLSVCVRDRAACIRIVGRANFTSSVDFKRVVQQLQEDGCEHLVLDLRECRLMDSTFLGVLAAVASRFDAARQQSGRAALELFQPSERVSELLDNLDVLKLFTVTDVAPPFECFRPVEDARASRTELNRTCYEAHETLRHTNPENERRFKDAAEFFAKNLREGEANKE